MEKKLEIEVPRSYSDYEIKLNKENLPSGIDIDATNSFGIG